MFLLFTSHGSLPISEEFLRLATWLELKYEYKRNVQLHCTVFFQKGLYLLGLICLLWACFLWMVLVHQFGAYFLWNDFDLIHDLEHVGMFDYRSSFPHHEDLSWI